MRCKGSAATAALPSMIDQDGYVYVLSRVDDVMNVAGHRLSTSLLEQGSFDLVLPLLLSAHHPYYYVISLELGQSYQVMI